MSYFADIIKKHIRIRLQTEAEVERANQILESAPKKLEETDQEIQKAVQAAEILGESQEVAQALYDTYPDLDVTRFGLPEASDRPLDPIEEPDEGNEPELDDAPELDEGETIDPDADEAQ